MPFKLKLKKSRQYNVSSKNLFVISVELLDNTTVECTLSAQSLGQECLHNVCQRLGLHQPQYFGLCFLSKKGGYWWIDLQRPLKKQMDKYAQEGSSLCLGVMYFVSDVNMLHDEVTRYHYFLQLKSDIIEGRLKCSEEQTVLLAGYSLQAEFGDHDPERHTTEYLTNFGLLPKHMAHGKGSQEAVLEKVIHMHRTLQGMSQQFAEVCYIMEAQRLEGYGQQCFAGKDSTGAAVILGLSLKGIFIRYMNDQPAQCFLWDHIINLVHHKRCFGIECRDRPRVIQTYMEDSQVAKYVWKTCIQQHQFYTKNSGASRNQKSSDLTVNSLSTNSFSVHSPVNTIPEKKHSPAECKPNETKNRCIQIQESHESLDGLGVYHTDGGYSEVVSSLAAHDLGVPTDEDVSTITNQHGQLLNSAVPLTSSTPTLQATYSQPLPASNLRISSSDVQLHSASTSDPPFYQVNPVDQMPQSQHPVVPSYRQAPDYETAVKIKYGIQNSGEISNASLVQSLSTPATRSQIDTFSVMKYQSSIPVQSYAQYKNYTDLSHLDVNEFQNETTEKFVPRHYENVPHPCVHPPVHTYSSPELASQNLVGNITPEQLVTKAHLLYQFKPPPPYPYKQSSSTPDLTKSHQQLSEDPSHNCMSSKDFIVASSANYGYHTEAQTHQNFPRPQDLDEHLKYSSTALPCSSSSDSNLANFANINSGASGSSSNLGNGRHYAVPHSQVQNSLPGHSYQNLNPSISQMSGVESTTCRVTEQAFSSVMTAQSTEVSYQMPQSATAMSKPPDSTGNKRITTSRIHQLEKSKPTNLSLNDESQTMGPLLVAAMNGLTLSQPDIIASSDIDDRRFPTDSRIQALETKLLEGQVFLEFEHIIKKKPMADFSTALLTENIPRNRFKDVFPYEENRVKLTPTNENKTGYINASHLTVSVGGVQRFYIAAQGPLPNTLYSFWQMVWEHHVSVIVMLTEVQEEGQDKCFPYWPQDDGKTLQIGEFQIARNFSMSSPTYITCSLTLCHVTSHQQRSVWHIQYTDWPDHSCPEDVHGFIKFMGEVDAVRRLAASQLPQESHNTSPIVVHCSAGVGRSGVVILCDIMLYALDHNQPIDIPKALTQLRLQRMLTVQTLAQYKFVYVVLVKYLRNSRLI